MPRGFGNSRDLSRTSFPAAHPGKCPLCGERFEADDPIAYVDSEVVCEDCWEDARK